MRLLVCTYSILAIFSLPTLAQTVRLETSLGVIDIELFPDKAPQNVANFLNYVTSGRYDNTVINRADTTTYPGENHVLQMGLYNSTTQSPPPTINGFLEIPLDPPVNGETASSTGLTHEPGTVSFALIGGLGNVDADSGQSSFFINGRLNSFLDEEFSIFGRVRDMDTVSAIFAADKFLDGRSRYNTGPHFSNIPLRPNGDLVFIEAAYLIPEPSSTILLASLVIWSRRWQSLRHS